MSAMTQEAMPAESDLLESFLALETPAGFKAELVEGKIVVSPTPDGDHEDCISTIIRAVLTTSKVPMDASGNKGLKMPAGGSPKNHVIPDITFAPRELRLFRGAPSWMPSDGVAMVVEVTSSRPSDDRTVKRHCYARAGIPLYLIVDRSEGQVLVYSGPSDGDYLHGATVALGESLPLPEPFGFALETSDFL
ncbi:Uma2 family endonuclease [Streptacidiphilus anmyonensis]|uniref:Uma2 family endonuclease n=1 Tax=Streptacidiphilus anmyonensis TaxID=405782 RepID=UPI0005A72E31|nr:Uma2 family endonuclease [Streptacidiphilus anmyonensis]